jgi:hypothetical protein
MDPADIYYALRNEVRSFLPRIADNTWFEHKDFELFKLSDNLAIPKQQFESMGVSFEENGTSPKLDFTKFTRFMCVSHNARMDNLETIKRQRNKFNGLQNQLNTTNSELASERENCHDLQNQLNTANSELSLKDVELESQKEVLNLKEIELSAKNEIISHLEAAMQQPATPSNKFHLITSPRVIIPVGTVTVLEVVAHQTNKPKLAPSYWAKRGVCVVGKFPLKVWNSIFDSTDANLTTDGNRDKDDMVSSNICDEKAIFDLSLNSEYKSVQVQEVSPNPPTGLIRPSYISLFSFTL